MTVTPVNLLDDETFDFIIVGGGSAGCVLASRLSEVSTWKVLLLEAGGEEPPVVDVPAFITNSWDSALDWQYKTKPNKDYCGGKSCTWNSGKVLGGTSILNGMVYNRGSPQSYDDWKALGNEGWGFSDVLPYFKKSENNLNPSFAVNKKYHSTGGLLPVQRFPYQDKNVEPLLNALQELGYNQTDINGGKQTGSMLMQFTQMNGRRMSTNMAFLEPIRYRENLKVVTGVRVTKVLIHKENKTAYGVECAWENTKLIRGRAFAAKEVILSSGALKSPQVLMLSGIGPTKVLETAGIEVIKDLPVGENLQDHGTSAGIELILEDRQTVKPSNQQLLMDIFQYTTQQKGPLSAPGPLQVTAYIKSRFAQGSTDDPDIQYFLPSQSQYGSTPFNSPMCYYNRIMFQTGIMKAKSRGMLTLNSSDPFLQPIIEPNYFGNIDDLYVIIDGYNFIAKNLSQTSVLKNLGVRLDTTPLPDCAHLNYGNDDYWNCIARNYTLTLHHFSGTCKMGPAGDKTAVVDPQLKVHDISGLRVADASIMPVLGNSNTNAPVIMIAEKASDMIKTTWK